MKSLTYFEYFEFCECTHLIRVVVNKVWGVFPHIKTRFPTLAGIQDILIRHY